MDLQNFRTLELWSIAQGIFAAFGLVLLALGWVMGKNAVARRTASGSSQKLGSRVLLAFGLFALGLLMASGVYFFRSAPSIGTYYGTAVNLPI